ncbi:MAG: hypothetical protein WA821_12935 [Anaerolineales bacterium]
MAQQLLSYNRLTTYRGAAPMPDQPTTILNDKAVESLKEDALDFTPYVQALADIAMTGSTPLKR